MLLLLAVVVAMVGRWADGAKTSAGGGVAPVQTLEIGVLPEQLEHIREARRPLRFVHNVGRDD